MGTLTESKYDDEEEEDLTGAAMNGDADADEDMKEISEQDSWTVIDAYFNDRGLVRQQVRMAACLSRRACGVEYAKRARPSSPHS